MHAIYSEPTLYSNSEFGEGEGPIVLSNVECGGWETDIFQCSSKKYLSFSCPRTHTAGVLCRDCELLCPTHAGHVKVCCFEAALTSLQKAQCNKQSLLCTNCLVQSMALLPNDNQLSKKAGFKFNCNNYTCYMRSHRMKGTVLILQAISHPVTSFHVISRVILAISPQQ